MARGGRGGGSRNPANQSRDVQVSRKVSWLLRHGAGQEGLKLGKGGYVNVQEAVSLYITLCSGKSDTRSIRRRGYLKTFMSTHIGTK